MCRVAIIDDEYKIREVLRLKLQNLDVNIEIVGEAATAQEAYEVIQQTKPELIFLDISMPGETGLELLDRFDKFDFEIIFATGYDEYALDALKLSAVDYILKPFRSEDLRSALERAKSRIDSRKALQQYQVLKNNLKATDKNEKTITVVNGSSYEVIKVRDVVRCEGWQKYTKIFTRQGIKYVSSYNLGHFASVLDEFGFYACHKSHIMNIELIQSYDKDRGFAIMQDGSEIPVSRRRRTEFVNSILQS